MAIKTANEFKNELISYLKDAKEIITENPLTFVIITPNKQYRYSFSTLDPVSASQDNKWWILISWEGDEDDFDPYEELEVSEKFYQKMLRLIHIKIIAKSNEPKPKTILEQLVDKIKTEQNRLIELPSSSIGKEAIISGQLAALENVLKWIEELQNEI